MRGVLAHDGGGRQQHPSAAAAGGAIIRAIPAVASRDIQRIVAAQGDGFLRNQRQRAAAAGRPISMVTCYDSWSAALIAETDIDCVLVGDSLGMVAYGYTGTVPVTMDQCIYHTEAVRRAAPNTLLELKYDGIRIPIKGGS